MRTGVLLSLMICIMVFICACDWSNLSFLFPFWISAAKKCIVHVTQRPLSKNDRIKRGDADRSSKDMEHIN